MMRRLIASERTANGTRVMSPMAAAISHSYAQRVRGKPVEASTFATIAYFVTLVVVRAFATATRGETRDYVSIAGVHVHHLVIGMILVLIAGVFALDELFRLPRAVLFGIGAALVLDEFALVVYLKDVYWLPQGVLSLAALSIGLVALALNAWRGRAFLREAAAAIRRHS